MNLSLINRLIGSYQLDNELIMQVGGISVVIFVSLIVIYKIRSTINNKNKYIILNENKISNTKDDFNIKKVMQEYEDMTIETVDFDNNNLTFSKKPRYSEEEKLSLYSVSEKLIEEAIVLDTINKKTEAILSLKNALYNAELPNEKTRIQIILNKYTLSTSHNLEKLVEEFPPLNKLIINQEGKKKNKIVEPINFSIEKDFVSLSKLPILNTEHNQFTNNISLEEKIANLAEQAKQIEIEADISNKEDHNNFLLAFGNMVEVNPNTQNEHKKTINTINSVSTKQKLFVNWSRLENGQTISHSDFYEIDNIWESEDATVELQNILNKENSTQCTILSVFPMSD